MGRSRGFDEDQVLASAADLFLRLGYEGASVDDLVGATGLHRGSLYNAFGSKRGLFVAALSRAVRDLSANPVRQGGPGPATLDLLLVAALEVAPRDGEVAELLAKACDGLRSQLPAEDVPRLLGRRLLRRAGVPDPVLS